MKLTVKYFSSLCLIMFFLIFTGFNACSSKEPENNGNIKKMTKQNNRVPGEYLIKLSADNGEKEINDLFKTYGIESITPIGERLFKVKLENDPGPETIKEIADKSVKIDYAEPNYIYRINPPGKKEKLQNIK